MKLALIALVAFASMPALGNAAPTAAISMPDNFKGLKPGLWEVTRRSESIAPPISAASIDLSGLDAAARARVQAVLARQAAERAARGGAPEVTVHTKRECLTPEILASRKSPLDRERRGECPPVVKTRTASRLVLTSQCTIEGHEFSVEMSFEVKSPVETVSSVTSTGAYGGQPTKSADTSTARWIAADCGTVKPAR